MRSHWDRWGWIAAVTLIAVGFLRIIWGREAFCGSEAEHCLREWVSALGGWVAVVVAVPTIVFLSKQVKDAGSYQQQNLQVQLWRRRAVVLRAKKSAMRAQNLAEAFYTQWDDETYRTMSAFRLVDGYERYTSILLKAVSEPSLEFVENEVAFIQSMSLQRLKEILDVEKFKGLLNEEMRDFLADIGEDKVQYSMMQNCHLVAQWMRECVRECDLHLAKMSEIAGFDDPHHPANASST